MHRRFNWPSQQAMLQLAWDEVARVAATIVTADAVTLPTLGNFGFWEIVHTFAARDTHTKPVSLSIVHTTELKQCARCVSSRFVYVQLSRQTRKRNKHRIAPNGQYVTVPVSASSVGYRLYLDIGPQHKTQTFIAAFVFSYFVWFSHSLKTETNMKVYE